MLDLATSESTKFVAHNHVILVVNFEPENRVLFGIQRNPLEFNVIGLPGNEAYGETTFSKQHVVTGLEPTPYFLPLQEMAKL